MKNRIRTWMIPLKISPCFEITSLKQLNSSNDTSYSETVIEFMKSSGWERSEVNRPSLPYVVFPWLTIYLSNELVIQRLSKIIFFTSIIHSIIEWQRKSSGVKCLWSGWVIDMWCWNRISFGWLSPRNSYDFGTLWAKKACTGSTKTIINLCRRPILFG